VRNAAASAREAAYRANIEIAASGLVTGTFGNVSVVDRDAAVFFIKPSGVAYEELTAEHMVAVRLDTGAAIDSRFRPSSDTPTHLELYRAFAGCGAIVHTPSEFATVLLQARVPIRCMGTTHADHFHGEIPVTRAMRREEVEDEYERNTGLVIVETFRASAVSPEQVPAVLVASHGPFAWGPDAPCALENARALEYVARLEWRLRAMGAEPEAPAQCLIDKHYHRKHGSTAYYGQK